MKKLHALLRLALLLVVLALPAPALTAPRAPNRTLLDLAKKKFAAEGLTAAEEKLFTNAEKGELISGSVDGDKEANPNTADNWPSQRVIRADRLAWLCTDRDAS